MAVEVLKVAGNTPCTKLAGAIAGIVTKGNDCELLSIGAGPLNQTIKALCIAQRMLAPNGVVLSFRPGFVSLDLSQEKGGKSDVTAIRIKVLVDK
jgi:stage V sporulation protein SpoVS